MPLGFPGKAEEGRDPQVRRPACASHPSDARGVHSGRLPQRWRAENRRGGLGCFVLQL